MDPFVTPDADPAQTPFAGLTPALILDAVESLGLRPDGRLTALNSYENRVYQIGMEDGAPLVAKFYRPGRWSRDAILEEHAFVTDLADAGLAVVPPLVLGGETLTTFADQQLALYPKRAGRLQDADSAAMREALGLLLGRLHARAAGSFAYRPVLTVDDYGRHELAYIIHHDLVTPKLADTYHRVATAVLDKASAIWAEVNPVALRLHGDLHAGNVLWTPDGPQLVDFDDCRTGPAIQDLWMLVSGTRQERIGQMADVLAGYEEHAEFDSRELRLLEVMRSVRFIHHAAWLGRRWRDPAFPAAFPWFGKEDYWQAQIQQLQQQMSAMDDAPLW